MGLSTNIDVNSWTISALNLFLTDHQWWGIFLWILISIIVILVGAWLIKKWFIDEKIWDKIKQDTECIKWHTEKIIEHLHNS